jgi:mannose-6-phosphate isomerase-like protein (cupin superfamily)
MASGSPIDRRTLLLAGGVTAALEALFHAAAASNAAGVERAAAGTGVVPRRMHGGRGIIDVRWFFESHRPARPALLLEYDIPPGASEGVHTHAVGSAEGAWDEFYYIAAGSGRMSVGGETMEVAAGDTVHTPLGVPHGIENTSGDARLRVFLVAVDRG